MDLHPKDTFYRSGFKKLRLTFKKEMNIRVKRKEILGF